MPAVVEIAGNAAVGKGIAHIGQSLGGLFGRVDGHTAQIGKGKSFAIFIVGTLYLKSRGGTAPEKIVRKTVEIICVLLLLLKNNYMPISRRTAFWASLTSFNSSSR